jgi:hypothetical protein
MDELLEILEVSVSIVWEGQFHCGIGRDKEESCHVGFDFRALL